ncbi:MAG: DUF192 domain-containing protein [Candidatus Taylorbacteria bacterium]|nr:DUF192 domain-containing protein [Candidatus Taylorbacteria bacterium]
MFKKVILIISIGLALLIATSYFFFRQDKPDLPSEYQMAGQNEKVIHINGRALTVEIADEPHEQAQGLSSRESLGQEQGMLFVFQQPLVPSFWMKDMGFALDMLWIDADGKVIAITKNISPDTYPETFSPPSPILYVLEVNAGWSDRNNIKVGDVVSF